ncbi:MAG: hypothetical protein WCT10_04075 [Patescibacteria group bacterium]
MRAVRSLFASSVVIALSLSVVGCEPDAVEVGPYQLVRVPIGDSDNPYRPVFVMIHDLQSDGSFRTALQFVWRQSDDEATLMTAVPEEKALVQIVKNSCDPQVTFVYRDTKDCAGAIAHPQYFDGDGSSVYQECLKEVRLVCCREDLPEGVDVWSP